MSKGFTWDLGRLIGRSKGNTESEALLTLQQVLAFESLKEKSLRDLAEVMHFRDYRANEFLYHEDDPGLGLYILQTGAVRLSKVDQDGDSYEIEVLTEGSMFGADSLLGERTRFETAQVISDARLIGFFKPDLETLLRRLPELGAEIVAALANQIAIRHERLLRKVASIENGRELIESDFKIEGK